MTDIGPFDANVRATRVHSGTVQLVPAAVGVVSAVGLPIGTGRFKIQVHNPGSSDIWFYPALAPNGSPQVLAPGAAGTIWVMSGAYSPEISPCGFGAWNVVGNTTGAATFLVFNGP